MLAYRCEGMPPGRTTARENHHWGWPSYTPPLSWAAYGPPMVSRKALFSTAVTE